jgi:hypothetical protein
MSAATSDALTRLARAMKLSAVSGGMGDSSERCPQEGAFVLETMRVNGAVRLVLDTALWAALDDAGQGLAVLGAETWGHDATHFPAE